jgi:hypothetical protein
MNLNLIFGSTGNDSLNIPQGLALGLDDEVAIADTNNHRCLVYSIRGQQMRQIGSSGTEEGSLYYPKKVFSFYILYLFWLSFSNSFLIGCFNDSKPRMSLHHS